MLIESTDVIGITGGLAMLLQSDTSGTSRSIVPGTSRRRARSAAWSRTGSAPSLAGEPRNGAVFADTFPGGGHGGIVDHRRRSL